MTGIACKCGAEERGKKCCTKMEVPGGPENRKSDVSCRVFIVRRKPAGWGQSLKEKEEQRRLENQKYEWMEKCFDDERVEEEVVPMTSAETTKADRRGNIAGIKKTYRQELEEGNDPEKVTKKFKWESAVPGLFTEKGNSESLKNSMLELTVADLIELKKDMTKEQKMRVTSLGEEWKALMGGSDVLRQSPDLMDIDPKDIEIVVERRLEVQEVLTRNILEGSPRVQVKSKPSDWTSLPKEVVQRLEKGFLKNEETGKFRCINRKMMRNWWKLPEDRVEFYDWEIFMCKKRL